MPSKQRDITQASESSARQSRLDRPQTETSVSLGWGRREFLCASSVAVAGLFAGCTNIGGDDTRFERRNNGADDGSEPSSVDEWLAETDNYDSVEDLTGKNSTTVEVGAEGNNGSNAFAPTAIEVSPGTTVTWEWVNGYHNVVATDGQFNSGEAEQNATFQHTFETAGTVFYYCDPHKSMDMKGAVIVAGSDRTERSSASSQTQSGDTTSAGNTATQTEAQ